MAFTISRIRCFAGLLLLAATAVVLAGCPDDAPRVPQRIDVTPTTATLTALGDTARFSAEVIDDAGATMADVAVQWSCPDAAVASVASGGLATAVGPGSTAIEAAAEGLTGTATLTVAQEVAGVAKVAGDAQTGEVGSTLATELEVEVVDAGGHPITAAAVTFAVTGGGGAVSPANAVTDAEGRASASWTLGTGAGDQTVEAQAGSETPLVFTAEAVPGPPVAMTRTGGDGQTAYVGETLPDPISVGVVDQYDNPVSGATVQWVVTDGGGDVSPASTDTDASGAGADWTLGTTPGENRAEARSSGLQDVAFSAMAEAGPASAMTKVSGDGQMGAPSTTLASPLVVEVVDPYGNPVPEVTVEFTASAGSVSPESEATDADGRASTELTLPSSSGTVTVRAEVDGGPEVRFQAESAAARFYLNQDLSLTNDPVTGWYVQRYFYRTTVEWTGVIEEGGIGAGEVYFDLWLAVSSNAQFEVTLLVRSGGSETEVASTTFQVPRDDYYREFSDTVDGAAAGGPGDTVILRVKHSGSANGALLYGDPWDAHVAVPGAVELSSDGAAIGGEATSSKNVAPAGSGPVRYTGPPARGQGSS